MCLCARTRLSDPAAQQIRDILQNTDVDWTVFTNAVISQEVVALVHRSFNQAAADLVPQEILDAISVYVADQGKRCQVLMEELLALLRLAEAEGIPALSFKGPVLTRTLYGDVALRPSSDLDILFGDNELEAFSELLLGRGYREMDEIVPIAELERHLCFFRDRDGIAVEPHWAVVGQGLAINIDHAGLWQRSRVIDADGNKVRVFSAEDELIVLCTHGTSHKWATLKWICDIAELIGGDAPLAWDIALARARDQGCERIVLLGVLLAERLLDARLPAIVATAIKADSKVSDLADEVGFHVLNRANHRLTLLFTNWFLFRVRERRRDKVAFLMQLLTRTRFYRFNKRPLPRLLLPVYILAALVNDYVLRPLGLRRRRPASDTAAIPPTAAPMVISAADWAERADAWRKAASRSSETAEELNGRLLDAAGVRAGQTVLDLASGVGEPALAAADRLGPNGTLVATDLAPAMLTGLNGRLTEAGIGTVRCCAADMAALPFADGLFDAAHCRYGIMFADPVDAALRELHRVLRPGARAAFLVWGPRQDNTIFAVMEEQVSYFLGRTDDNAGMFRYAGNGSLAAALGEAGFVSIEEQEIRYGRTEPVGEAFWRANLEMTYGRAVTDLPDSLRALIDERLEAGFANVARDGHYTLSAHFRLVVGEKPVSRPISEMASGSAE